MKKEKLLVLLWLSILALINYPITQIYTSIIIKIESMILCHSIADCKVWGSTGLSILLFFINWFILVYSYILFRKTSNSRYNAESKKAKKFLLPLIFLYLLTTLMVLNLLYIKTDSLGIHYKNNFLAWNKIKAIGTAYSWHKNRYSSNKCIPDNTAIVLSDNSLKTIPSILIHADLISYLIEVKGIPYSGIVKGCGPKP